MVALIPSVAGLTDAVRAGSPVKFLFFWGHQPQRDGSIGAGCLSQWWPDPFSVDGQEFRTAEHYMMWRKAVLFGDATAAARILTVAHPHAAKTLGRQVDGFDERVWQEHRLDIVVAGAVAKFGQRPELREYLLGTGERVLVEASPVDRVWGIGLAADHPDAVDPARWRGLNLLGFALMRARTMLGAQATP
ncbi:NADAR family protein [Micromonospora sp. NPDC005215]|uniref:NADAR family protein n=1 Tax=Micromonospora sp. NPDC005215 TaxID=3157024 RepID=UPI0033BCAC1B